MHTLHIHKIWNNYDSIKAIETFNIIQRNILLNITFIYFFPCTKRKGTTLFEE